MSVKVDLKDFTTLRVGGAARRFVIATSPEQLVAVVAEADAAGEPVLLLGGGSNLVVADAGFDGVVVHVQTRGVRQIARAAWVEIEAAAGEPWDVFVAQTVAAGLRGLEALSGIPGLVGATPMQNVGAYGQEVSDTISAVRVYDRRDARERVLDCAACQFGYRTSALKDAAPRFVVLSVTFRLAVSVQSTPIRYAELARAASVSEGETVELSHLRQVVLALRRQKGMVVDAADPDSASAGSFFMNPTLGAGELAALDARVAERLGAHERAPRFPQADGRAKVAAAWLIERAGFAKGFGAGRVGISSRHALAIVNRGGGTASEVCALGKTIRDGVRDAFGVELSPEPQMIGCTLGD